ncbi:DUF6809 family protein [Chakrabartyella piscis]|uniref:DUF6809 family protein n=1 Tax=Chakrabartyella piscis TaxID=2918914 RepID=UPI0029585067|nr:DUF6809 family protein [Chakrabartyella piscis]
MAKSTIKSIFNGDIMLWEAVYQRNQEQKKSEDLLDTEMEYLTRHMSKEDKHRFEEYIWKRLEQDYEDTIDAQVNAFVLGVHVGMELLQ